jgi:Zn-finger nucleic acid-binding protein
MKAETLNCPMCGAATSSDAVKCPFCNSRLATVACPSCFGMIFKGSRFCSHCGAAYDRSDSSEDIASKCPRCVIAMSRVQLGPSAMEECPECSGLWVDAVSFERICADREEQAAVLGTASPAPSHAVDLPAGSKVRYIPCPQCGQLMNRINIARCSGVVVDVCKGHGTWFDRDELRQIVEFVRGGGLEASRARERADIEEARRALARDQLAATMGDKSNGLFNEVESRSNALGAARGILRFLLD